MEKANNFDNQIFNIIEEIQDIIEAIQSNPDMQRRYVKVPLHNQN